MRGVLCRRWIHMNKTGPGSEEANPPPNGLQITKFFFSSAQLLNNITDFQRTESCCRLKGDILISYP